MSKIAVVDKQPSRTKYDKYFEFEFDLYHLSSVPVAKMLKKDVDLVDFNPDDYDFVILVGSEAVKHIAKLTAIGDKAGHLINNKFIPIINPSMLIFKPEAQAAFDESLKKLHRNITGDLVVKTHGEFIGIQNEDEAISYLTDVLHNTVGDAVALDCETSGLYARNCHVLGISISNGIRKGAYISSDYISDECVQILQAIIDKYLIVMHNAKFDIAMLEYHFGLKFHENSTHDTILMHYILDENIGTHGLKDLALKFTDYGDYDRALEDFKKDYCAKYKLPVKEFTYDLIPFEIMYRYAAIDTAVTIELFERFRKIIFAKGSEKICSAYTNIMIPGLFMLVEMEGNGIPFSKSRLKFGKQYLDKKLLEATETLYHSEEIQKFQIAQGKEFNPNSPIQLRVFLFDYLGLTSPGKLTDGGDLSTDAEVLEQLEDQHPLVKHLMVIRKLTKIKNTYIENLLLVLDKDSRVRTNFNITSTTSGRLSSSGKFNAQQLPRDHPVVKGSIVAREGYKIVSQDLATAEMYYAAVLSGDKALQKVFVEGKDFHSSIAKQVFKLKCLPEEVKKLFPIKRQAAKAVSFGILYGSGADKVSTTVTKESGEPFYVEEAREVIDDYFDTFPRLRKWLDDSKAQIKKHGFIYSAFGRKRRLKNVFSPDRGIAGHALRSGINFLVQSVASDINLLAAVEVNRLIKTIGLDAKLIMLVHDSIVAEVKDEDIEKYCEILKECTQRDRGVSIPGTPIGVDVDIGQDYSFGKFDEKHGKEFEEYQISGISNTN